MEDMRPVLMHEDTGVVVPVVGIAADMRTTVDDQNLLLALARNPLCKHTAGKARTHDQPIKHLIPRWPLLFERSGQIAPMMLPLSEAYEFACSCRATSHPRMSSRADGRPAPASRAG